MIAKTNDCLTDGHQVNAEGWSRTGTILILKRIWQKCNIYSLLCAIGLLTNWTNRQIFVNIHLRRMCWVQVIIILWAVIILGKCGRERPPGSGSGHMWSVNCQTPARSLSVFVQTILNRFLFKSLSVFVQTILDTFLFKSYNSKRSSLQNPVNVCSDNSKWISFQIPLCIVQTIPNGFFLQIPVYIHIFRQF